MVTRHNLRLFASLFAVLQSSHRDLSIDTLSTFSTPRVLRLHADPRPPEAHDLGWHEMRHARTDWCLATSSPAPAATYTPEQSRLAHPPVCILPWYSLVMASTGVRVNPIQHRLVNHCCPARG